MRDARGRTPSVPSVSLRNYHHHVIILPFGHLKVQAIPSRKDELCVAGNKLESTVALYHAGEVGETTCPDVEVLVALYAERVV